MNRKVLQALVLTACLIICTGIYTPSAAQQPSSEKKELTASDKRGLIPSDHNTALTGEVKKLIFIRGGSFFHNKTVMISFVAGLTLIILSVTGIIIWNRTLRRIVETRTLALNRELAERKKSEESLKLLEAKLLTAIEIAHLGYWEYDIVQDIFTFNDQFYKIFRTTAEEVGGYRISSDEYARRFVHPEDRYLVSEEVQKCIKTRDPNFCRQLEHRIIYADGETGHIQVRFFVIMDSELRTIRTYGVNQDITERVMYNRALMDSEARFRALHNASFGGICIHDKGLIIECNRGLSEITGYEYRELIGMNGLLLISDETREMVIRNIEAGYEKPYEAEGIRKNGESYPLRLEARNIPYKDKSVRVVEFRDITENRRAEKDRDELEEKLRQSQKMEAVGRLAGGVAHDFNNMLSLIIGHADMALEKIDPEETLYTDIEEIRKAGERSADLTRQLLAFARKQTVSPKVLDLNTTVEGMTKMLRRLIGEYIELIWLPGKDVWPVKMDPSQLDQILANLCVNSRDAISDIGKITIRTENADLDENFCTSHPGFTPGEYVLLSVIDNGLGMDTETLANIFEPFFTTKAPGKGTGLGLATVYGAVRQNNGFVNVRSGTGRGTEFEIYFPRHSTEIDFKREDAKSPPVVERGHETILLVEDEPAILKMISTILERMGYRVLAARTPGEAIRFTDEYMSEIHLLVTDVIMPEMNGKDLAGRILTIHPNLRRLFMSGYTADIIAHHGVLGEGVHFLQKPFSREQLCMKVREVLSS